MGIIQRSLSIIYPHPPLAAHLLPRTISHIVPVLRAWRGAEHTMWRHGTPLACALACLFVCLDASRKKKQTHPPSGTLARPHARTHFAPAPGLLHLPSVPCISGRSLGSRPRDLARRRRDYTRPLQISPQHPSPHLSSSGFTCFFPSPNPPFSTPSPRVPVWLRGWEMKRERGCPLLLRF